MFLVFIFQSKIEKKLKIPTTNSPLSCPMDENFEFEDHSLDPLIEDAINHTRVRLRLRYF